MIAAAEILRALQDLPVIDRERVYRAILQEASVEELTAELCTVDPGDYSWDDLVWFAKKILALDNDFQKETALDEETPPACDAGGVDLQLNDKGREPDDYDSPTAGREQAPPA